MRAATTSYDEQAITLEAKVSFLHSPEAYPDRPARIEAIETHMSWVFLTDHYAYKLKKPVRRSFLDFSTIDARHRNCMEEVRLNRRLAPRIYLGVVPLTIDPAGRMHLNGDGTPIDWLVHMLRLPAERMMDALIRAGTLQPEDARPAATLLARFYHEATSHQHSLLSPHAYHHRFARDIRTNLRTFLKPEFDLPRDRITRLTRAQYAMLDHLGPNLAERILRGFIIEGHGDLRPEHICLTTPQPAIIDCLEFNRDLRLLDPVDELAFLALEIHRLGSRRDISDIFMSEYRSATSDHPPEELIRFYQSIRASIRARLALWHIRDTPAARAAW